MSCFSYTFFKCREEASGARILDDLFTPLNNYDVSGMFKDPQKSINMATEMAYNSMVAALIEKTGRIKESLSIIKGGRFEEGYSSGSGNVDLLCNPKQKIRINTIYVNVNHAGTVNIKLENELGVITTIPVTVTAGVTATKAIDQTFKFVNVRLNESVPCRHVLECGVNGMLIDYSVICDYDTYICANKSLYQTAMDYKVASILLTDSQFSGQVAKREMMSKTYSELKSEYEAQYQLELRNLSIEGSGCFECRKAVKVASWL